ncbi:MAG: hypothetical protein WC123_07695, partial [Bacilli bacterium]
LFNINDFSLVNEIIKNVEDFYYLDIEVLFEKEIIIDDKKRINVVANQKFWNLMLDDSISSVVNKIDILE